MVCLQTGRVLHLNERGPQKARKAGKSTLQQSTKSIESGSFSTKEEPYHSQQQYSSRQSSKTQSSLVLTHASTISLLNHLHPSKQTKPHAKHSPSNHITLGPLPSISPTSSSQQTTYQTSSKTAPHPSFPSSSRNPEEKIDCLSRRGVSNTEECMMC